MCSPLQLKILTNQYTVLPAAGGFVLAAGVSGFQEQHGFVTTIGVSSCGSLVTAGPHKQAAGPARMQSSVRS